MATRVIPPRILKNLRYNTRALDSSHSSIPSSIAPSLVIEKPSSATTAPPSTATELNMEDSEQLFRSVSTRQLLRSSAVLHATAVGPMVDLGMWVMKSRVFERGVLKDMVMAATRETLYANFCAGEDAAAAGRSIGALNGGGLRGMLAYGVEDAHDNEGCDRNLEAFLHTVDVSKSLPPSSVSFVILMPSVTIFNI
ncbi:proline dehydrogenase 2, mitochondrial-like [Cajanus cajan]|uniref:proline dehydrogenase 2, mitochondrial-like n=1 Tax=Cajanus cajan TaxID=3821 RepID=UPI00098DC594|nr:proline dehydrogenase 2, mitochondrial-like [Cajanus cajan]